MYTLYTWDHSSFAKQGSSKVITAWTKGTTCNMRHVRKEPLVTQSDRDSIKSDAQVATKWLNRLPIHFLLSHSSLTFALNTGELRT